MDNILCGFESLSQLLHFVELIEEKIMSSYFPLVIKYTGNDYVTIIQSPEEIISGKEFVVLETKCE